MNAIVLGAGVVGTTTAWFLKKQGFDVLVIDRQNQAAQETSFANGGQISVSHALPWANPHVFGNVWRWLFKKNAPLLWHFRADFNQWRWAAQFLWQCQENKTRKNVAAILNLALFSRQTLQKLRQEEHLEYAQKTRGILHLYDNERELHHAQQAVRWMQEFGLERKWLNKEEALTLEPSLKHSHKNIIGADFTPSDESGDACLFTQELAQKAQQQGVQFLFNTHAQKLIGNNGKIAGVLIENHNHPHNQLLTADYYVVALGSFSAPFLKNLGINLPICPAKGYSITLSLTPQSIAPEVSLTDDSKKLVFSRLNNRLRVAGTAEFNGFNLNLDLPRAQNILNETLEWFPHIHFTGEPHFWCGLRPATPSNCPLIGKTTFDNLWLNTGHGTLGWTLSCGSAYLLAQMMANKPLKGIFAHRIFPFLDT